MYVLQYFSLLENAINENGRLVRISFNRRGGGWCFVRLCDATLLNGGCVYMVKSTQISNSGLVLRVYSAVAFRNR